MRFNEHILYDDRDTAVIRTFHSSVSKGNREYTDHHHTQYELSVFIKGSGAYSVNNIIHTFEVGDMFIFGSNEAHCITSIYEEFDLLNIHFEPCILWEHPENTELLNLFASRNKRFSNKLSGSDSALRKLILGVENELTQKAFGYRIQSKSILLSALIHILRTYDYFDRDNLIPINNASIKNLNKAMSFINNNLEQKLTLAQIADVACMAPPYFSTVFKRFNGLSPWSYIQIKRVENAVTLIKTTNMTKLEIAEKCGFSSSSNFYKTFFKITGRTPKDFEKDQSG